MADQLVDGPRRPADARSSAARRWTRGRPSSARPRHPIVRALDDAAARHALPLDELSTYMRSMRVDCEGPVRIGSWEELQAYMDGSAGTVGRIMAALLGLPAAPPRRPRPPRRRLPARELHPRRPRGPPAGPHLPARGGPRPLRRQRAATSTGTSPQLRALLAHEVARARALFAAARPAIAAAPRLRAPGRPPRRRPLRPHAAHRRRRPACASGTCPGAGDSRPGSRGAMSARRSAAPSARRSTPTPTC